LPFFVGDIISGVGLDLFGLGYQSWVPTTEGSISLKVLVETRLNLSLLRLWLVSWFKS